MTIVHLNSLGYEIDRFRSWAQFADEMRRGHIVREEGDQFVCRDSQAPWADPTRQQLDQIFDILRDIEATLDEKADVDDGRPNEAMRMLVGVRDVIRKLEGR